MIQKKDEAESIQEHEQELILKKIRDEYLKVHNVNKGNELLKRSGCLPKEQNINSHGEPFVMPNKSFEKIKGVHFDYINRAIPKENFEGQPEGS